MSVELFQAELVPLQILLVEDDQHLRLTLDEVLREEGYEVTAVASGTEAIKLCTEQRFDLIVTDIKTPGTDGLTALEQAKGENPATAGIVMTGYSTEEYATRAARLRVEDYLKKPFRMEQFLDTVDRLARQKRERQIQQGKEQSVLTLLKSTLLPFLESPLPSDLDSLLNHVGASSPLSSLDAREQTAMEVLALAELLARFEPDWWSQFANVAPARIGHTLAQGESNPLRAHLRESVKRFQAGDPAPEIPVPETDEDDNDPMAGSLLNLGLMLESADRIEEADATFRSLQAQSSDPRDRYPMHLARARIARRQRRFDDLLQQLREAVEEAQRLGPLTRIQALGKQGIELARAGHPEGGSALRQATQAAREAKDSTTYALCSLAGYRFLGEAADLSKLHAFLARPEQFEAALEESGWLLEAVLAAPQDQRPTQKLGQRLVRSCPKTFSELMIHSCDHSFLLNAVPYLRWLAPSERDRIEQRLSRLDSPELAERLRRLATEHQQDGEPEPTLRVFTFSGIRLFRDDQPLDLRRRKPLLLLVYLLHRNAPVAEEVLCETFWPGPEQKARGSLRTALSLLRKQLATPSMEDPFLRTAAGLALSPDSNVWFDHREFHNFLTLAGRHLENHRNRAVDSYRAALKLYQGPFLEGVYEDWALAVREQTEQAVNDTLRFLAQEFSTTRDWPEALEYAGRGLRRDPLSQPFCELTMNALIQLERPHEALQAFEECSASLNREMDLEPSIEMLRLREMARLNI